MKKKKQHENCVITRVTYRRVTRIYPQAQKQIETIHRKVTVIIMTSGLQTEH